MRIRFQWPMFHEDCYECGGSWRFQWPVRFERKRELSPTLKAIAASQSAIVSDAAKFQSGILWEKFGTVPPENGDLVIHVPKLGTAAFYTLIDRPLQDNVDDK